MSDYSYQLNLFGEPEPLRREHDFYATPFECVEAIKPVLDSIYNVPDLEARWLEPCAGDGAIMRHVSKVITPRYPIIWDAYEIRDTIIDPGSALIKTNATCHNFLADPSADHYDVCLTNPPFKNWESFLFACWNYCEDIIFLLPLSALGGKKRRDLYQEFPLSGLYILAARPSFTGDGATDSMVYAWFHWTPRRLHDGSIKFGVF